ncbi:hypothetical protein [Saccharopolyspora mangrovi]|uniref:Uncharacterized protein n=1 Tax=Saccharopolyspora mangrovi TaxID=3082379 RepID=A0ABU6A4S7_9PSEU|nr:hypothetical protein [Saccharopolyspora sp. S2-29]MEB3366551.1 hypothetical protein [Saccharopolyspora sp. S2-29]
MSDALQARLDRYREDRADRTTTTVVFEAIEHLRPHLPELVRTAHARPASPFAARPTRQRYLGSGPVQIRIHPEATQAEVLGQVSEELDGLPLATWIPPLLNAYLPGRKEPDNMPWLAQDTEA